MQITLEHLTKRFGDTVAVNDLKIHRTEYDIRHSAGVCGPRFV